jgi:CO/xanthine dehydrogenase Mo-binding subunit
MNSSGTVANGIGQPVRRKEDFRLLTGSGSFADDVLLPSLAHAAIVRSPHAHAQIASINTEAALGSPGVLAVLTGRDYLKDGLAPIPHNAGLMGPPDVAVRLRGFQPITTRDYPMPPDKVRFVGEPVAIVVAESIYQAKDAAELLESSYYAPQSGQLLAGSFMDYAMPRADALPLLATALSEVPAPSNRLGVRSGGEGGTTPALAVVIAIVDALAELGVRHVEMPATPSACGARSGRETPPR